MTATASKRASVARTKIADLLKLVNEKEAAEQGATSHPSKSVDDGTHDVSLGAHGNEDNATIKTQEPLGVANVSPNKPGEQAEYQTNMGVQAKPTGEDPSVEDDYKDTKDDPGSSMPARTDNSSLDGKKYAGVRSAFAKAAADLTAVLTEEFNKSAGVPAASNTPAAAQQKEAEAGRSLAELVIGGDLTAQEKQAADAVVTEEIAMVVKHASALADNLIDFYHGQKAAEDEEAAMAAAEAAGAQGGAGPGSPDGGSIDPALLQALLAGGEQMPPSSMGEMTGGGEAGAGGGDEEALMQALQQLPPEVLQQLLAEASGGGGGGEGGGAPPPEAGGGLPPEAALAAGGGGGEPKMAAVKTAASQQKVAKLRAVLAEVLGRNKK